MLLNLALSLKKSGKVNPIVFIPNASAGPLGDMLSKEGVEWYDTPPVFWFLWPKTGDTSKYLGMLRDSAAVYQDLLERVQADVVVVNTLTFLEGVLAAVNCNLPYVLWVHGILDAGMLERYEALTTVSEQVALDLAHKVVCCSNWAKNFFVHKCETAKLQTIHNWTAVPSEPSAEQENAVFSSLSTLESHKGIDVLIRAMDLIRDTGAELNIYGDGVAKAELEKLASDLELADRVHFCGRVADVDKVYDNSRAIIFPSFIEAFGMVAIEAMARGRPVIASRTGGLMEIIEDKVSGLLFEPGDVAELAERLKFAIENPNVMREIALTGHRQAFEFFNGSASVANFCKVIENVQTEFEHYTEQDYKALDTLDLFFMSKDQDPVDSFAGPGTSQARISSVGESDAFRSNFEELLDGRYAKGWVNFPEAKGPCEVDIFADGVFLGRCRAEAYRPDLEAAGFGDGHRGFLFPLPDAFLDGRKHEFGIKIASRDIHISNSPASFEAASFFSTEGASQAPGLASWAIRISGPENSNARMVSKRSWVRTIQRGERPFVLVVVDAPNPSIELIVERPFRALGLYGVEYRIVFENAPPDLDLVRRANVIVLARTSSNAALEIAAQAEQLQTPIVYLIDDDFTAIEKRVDVDESLQDPAMRGRFNKLLGYASCIGVFSLGLQKKLSARFDNVVLLPVMTDIEIFDALPNLDDSHRSSGEFRIGYAASKTHEKDVALVEGALSEILDRHSDVVVETVGQISKGLVGHPRYRHFEEIRGVDEFAKFLGGRDWKIGLSPLHDSPFNASKTDNKYRLYAAASIAGIYSDIEPYRDSVEDEKTGLLADAKAESWIRRIERLIGSSELRSKIVENSKLDIRKRYDSREVSMQYYNFLSKILEAPTILAVSADGRYKADGLVNLSANGTIKLKTIDSRSVSEKNFEYTDIVLFALSKNLSYHPLLATAQESGCKLICIVDLEAVRAEVNPNGANSSLTRNQILEMSECLIVYDRVGQNERVMSIVVNASLPVRQHMDGLDWSGRLLKTLSDENTFRSVSRDVERVDFKIGASDQETKAWAEVLRHLGYLVPR